MYVCPHCMNKKQAVVLDGIFWYTACFSLIRGFFYDKIYDMINTSAGIPGSGAMAAGRAMQKADSKKSGGT